MGLLEKAKKIKNQSLLNDEKDVQVESDIEKKFEQEELNKWEEEAKNTLEDSDN